MKNKEIRRNTAKKRKCHKHCQMNDIMQFGNV